ncbi:hypothetical protein HZA96_05915 [Candidatus Woesearchaeota archaeon]|nr:hypothetical protein [Candidatus Woesearchaeota archaeon]
MRRKHKKGDLSLSVNAIVVFVLAFSMLGVGLFVVNLIKEKVSKGVETAGNLDDLKTPPTSDNPLIIDEEVKVKNKKLTKLDIGFYHRNDGTIKSAKVDLTECIDTSTQEAVTEIPVVTSSTITEIETGEAVAFKITILPTLPQGTYICTMVVYDTETGKDSEDGIKESKQFFLNVGT